MKTATNEELQLSQKAGNGDQKALKVLFERYADNLYAFICRQVDDDLQNIQDTWQDTMIAAFRNISSYRGQSQFFTWLCSIARHKIIDHYRKAQMPANIISPISLEGYQNAIDKQLLPEDVIMNREYRLKVIEALAKLPDDYRIILIERYVNERSVQEIAISIRKSYKATESLLSRTRQSLRQLLF